MLNEDYIQGGYYQNNYTKEQNQQFAVQFDQITTKMALALDQNVSFSSEAMQQLVHEFYQFACRFWTPDREAWKSLAMSYVLPTGYRDTYEDYRQGLGKYVYDAICHYADTQL
jgi:hypothetical protein